MRPVVKWQIGQTNPPQSHSILSNYYPYGGAKPWLEQNLGCYCSYCEVWSSDLEVEHVISKNQDKTKISEWNNFLLACGRCNGKDNKSNKPVNLNQTYFPHLDNTLLAFEYREGGFVAVHPGLKEKIQIAKAQALLDLVGLDKFPGNPKYPPSQKHLLGFPENDKRWEHRRAQWEKAQRMLVKFEKKEISGSDVAKYAKERGFFSIWFSVFKNHTSVKYELINAFKGTAKDCFDNGANPIPRKQ